MTEYRVHLASSVSDLRALGVEEEARDLFSSGGAPGRCSTLECAAPSEGEEELVLALPAAPGGTAASSPGQVRVRLRRFDTVTAGQAWRTRFSMPRSRSLAAREWNLACHLLAMGISVPEPLVLAEQDRGWFARRSALITRVVEGATPLALWLAGEKDRGERARGLEAVELFLDRLAAARTVLPELSAETLMIGTSGGGDCAPEGVTRRRLPPVVASRLFGGRMVRRFGAAERRLHRAALGSLEPA